MAAQDGAMALWFLAPALALLFGVLALAPLGGQVLARGVVFIDLAVGQSAGAGARWGGGWMENHPWAAGVQLAAAGGALACAMAVAALARRRPGQREALIGLLYVAAASLAFLGARLDAHGRDRFAELLAADVLWASWPQVAWLAGCAALVGLAHAPRSRWMDRDALFYAGFALVASVAVPVLGLFVVFAALITPALWRRAGAPWWLSLAGTLAACAAGLGLSWWWDAPSGACVALAMSAWGVGSVSRRALPREEGAGPRH